MNRLYQLSLLLLITVFLQACATSNDLRGPEPVSAEQTQAINARIKALAETNQANMASSELLILDYGLETTSLLRDPRIVDLVMMGQGSRVLISFATDKSEKQMALMLTAVRLSKELEKMLVENEVRVSTHYDAKSKGNVLRISRIQP
ncbi:MAG: hypothetical protein H7A01_14435 [Hahellaceae bacterium]|nr:hypothetical protein [Hahellaceae bacterium]MCP5210255.1 hypothetical protein [Hahellaceae bacterium]